MKKEIILVGTFHLEQTEELIKNKEDEVKELVDYLADFKPTKIAVEWDKADDFKLNEEYQNFNGEYSFNEIQQIGFRLAHKLGLDKIQAINWDGNLTPDDMIALNGAIQNAYPEILGEMENLGDNTPAISVNFKLLKSYQELNNKKSIERLEKVYLSFVNVKDEKGMMVGFNFLNKWMERELMIFKNIIESSSIETEERILLLIGNDHLWMLNKLFDGIGWNVINPFSKQKTML